MPFLLTGVFSIIPLVIRDYKSTSKDQTLGLKRGKSAIKREAASLTRRKIIMWAILFGLVFFINYLFFTHTETMNKKEMSKEINQKEHNIPDSIAQSLAKGKKKYQEGNFRQAVAAFSKAISLNSKETRAYLGRGIAYSNLGMHDKAINDYTKVITLNPDNAEAYNSRGRAYLKKDLFDHTIKDCSNALQLNPEMATAYYTRGMAYKAQGLLDMAGKDFQKSCDLANKSGCKALKELSKKR